MLNIYYLRTYVKCLEFRDKKYSPDFLGTHGSGETVISTSNYNLVWHVLPWQEARRVGTAGNAQEGHGNHFPEEKQEGGKGVPGRTNSLDSWFIAGTNEEEHENEIQSKKRLSHESL